MLCCGASHRVLLDHFPTGKYVDIKDTISGFKGVLDGKYDDLPEVTRHTRHEQLDSALRVMQQHNRWIELRLPDKRAVQYCHDCLISPHVADGFLHGG